MLPVLLLCLVQGEPILDPQAWRSPSGEYELRMDPSQRDGLGPATYRLRHSGVEVWTHEYTFSLRDSVVTDSGNSFGYAHVGRPWSSDQRLQAIHLSPDGSALVRISAPRVSPGPDSSPSPQGEAVFLQPELDRVTIRVWDDSSGRGHEIWWMLRASTGAVLHPEQVDSDFDAAECSCILIKVRPVAGTPLVLEHWGVHGKTRGARFELVGPGGESTWHLDLPEDYESAVGRAVDEVWNDILESGAILDAGAPKHFVIRSVAHEKAFEFKVEQAPDVNSGWRVSEVSHQPFPSKVPSVDSTEAPRMVLDSLGSFSIGRGMEETVQPHLLRNVAATEVDAAGRLYVLDGLSHIIRRLDSNGNTTREFDPKEGDFLEKSRLGGLSVGPDGSVYERDFELLSKEHGLRWMSWSSDGQRLGWISLGLNRVTEEWRFKPVGRERWVVGYHELILVDADGHAKRKIARQPDRRWFRKLADAGVSPYGSVALLTSPGYDFPAHGFAVHLFDSEGAAIRSFDVPSDVRTWHPAVAWNGQWLVVARSDGRFLLIETSTGRRGSFVIPSVKSEDSQYLEPFFTAGGRELWLVERSTRIVRRFSPPGD